MTQQLALPIALDDDATFENFYVATSHVFLLKKLRDFSLENKFFYLAGTQGTGRTHLLQALVQSEIAKNHKAFYLSLSADHSFQPEILDDLENFSLVCLDDVDGVTKNSAWEHALFHAYNRMKDTSTRLIVSAEKPPALSDFLLPDLKSRLTEMLVLPIQPVNDAEKVEILMLRAKHRGLELSPEVAQYLLNHYSRDLKDLIQMLIRLDHAALAAQRKLTIPFVRAALSS